MNTTSEFTQLPPLVELGPDAPITPLPKRAPGHFAVLWNENGNSGLEQVEGPAAPAWKVLIEELQNIRNLEEDWDGLGARKPSVALVDGTRSLCRILWSKCHHEPGLFPWGVPPSRIVPGRDGSIILEWQVGAIYGELEMTEPTRGKMIMLAR